MSESLRDQLAANLENLDLAPAPEPTEQAPEVTAEPAVEVTPEPVDEKPGRTAGRERDEKGRLLPGPAKRDSAPASEKADAPTQPLPQGPEAAPVADRPPRPSTWKKDYWEHWDKIDPKLAQYLVQRESEFAKGVSTYKQEWDNAKPLIDAIAPFRQVLEQNGVQPAQWITNLGNAHQRLAMGSPQEKAAMFVKLAQDYQVPLQSLFTQGPDGGVYLNTQHLQNMPAAQQPQQPDVRKMVSELLQEERAQAELRAFASNQQQYPHFEAVRETMAGLLQAGLADDLASAYQAALRHPRHADIYETEQRLAREAEEKRVAEERQKAAQVARRNTVSVRSATPTAGATSSGGKGLRDQLSEAFDQAAGRV